MIVSKEHIDKLLWDVVEGKLVEKTQPKVDINDMLNELTKLYPWADYLRLDKHVGKEVKVSKEKAYKELFPLAERIIKEAVIGNSACQRCIIDLSNRLLLKTAKIALNGTEADIQWARETDEIDTQLNTIYSYLENKIYDYLENTIYDYLEKIQNYISDTSNETLYSAISSIISSLLDSFESRVKSYIDSWVSRTEEVINTHVDKTQLDSVTADDIMSCFNS